MIQFENITYSTDTVTCKGIIAFDDSIDETRPGVLVVHDWRGCIDFVHERAERLAKLGYIGFAVDMLGAQTNTDKSDKYRLIKPLIENRPEVHARISAAFNLLKADKRVNQQAIAGLGFCFGGMTVLDLARQHTDVRGVISFHGALKRPEHFAIQAIKAKVLVLHGYDDPAIPPEQVLAFADEMNTAQADWQIHMYGNTCHSFTNPQANEPEAGQQYNPDADRRSWQACENFLAEIFTTVK